MSEAYKPCDFDREFYLEDAEVYQQVGLHDADHELCEFNEDPEELAFELAYTRHALAALEKKVAELEKRPVVLCEKLDCVHNEGCIHGRGKCTSDTIIIGSDLQCDAHTQRETPALPDDNA